MGLDVEFDTVTALFRAGQVTDTLAGESSP